MASLATEVTIYVDRPVDEVFEFVSDPAKMPLWVRYVEEAGYTEDAEPRVGATFDLKYTYGARDSDITMESHRVQPSGAIRLHDGQGTLSDSCDVHSVGGWPRHAVHILSGRAVGRLITGCMFALLGFLLKYPTRGLLRKNAERMKAAIGGA